MTKDTATATQEGDTQQITHCSLVKQAQAQLTLCVGAIVLDNAGCYGLIALAWHSETGAGKAPNDRHRFRLTVSS